MSLAMDLSMDLYCKTDIALRVDACPALPGPRQNDRCFGLFLFRPSPGIDHQEMERIQERLTAARSVHDSLFPTVCSFDQKCYSLSWHHRQVETPIGQLRRPGRRHGGRMKWIEADRK